jgi:subtilisin family serine protease
MSLPDDSFGSAGSAGPIGVGVLIYTGYDFVTSINKDPGSNYGDGHVDIWGPYSMWLGPDPSEPENDATIKFGTSYSSPYVAGVAALVWAANPSLDASQVWDFLRKEAHTSRNVLVNRIVNARGAVASALGGSTPPYVRITSPEEGATFSRGSQAIPLNAEVDDLEGDIESIVWSSNRDGAVAEGAFTSTNDLSVGTHELTVTVTDSTDLSIAQTVTISVKNDPPEVEIISPENGASARQSHHHGGG